MEVRGFALGIVESRTLAAKLTRAPGGLTDRRPEPPLFLERPGRPAELRIVPGKEARVPARRGMADPAQRVRILHAFANHELQAVELFAWALLAFPGAEPDFRAGLLERVAEEQHHLRLYLERLSALGASLGDHPVSGYFWSKVKDLTSPRRFVSAMGLTFENANLDHMQDYAEAARASGDRETAALLERVHRDEVEHVRFAWKWLERLKDEGETMWEAYSSSVSWPLRGALARGKVFHAEGRVAAGLDPDFIGRLAQADRGQP